MSAGPTNPFATPYESPQSRGIGGLNLSGLWALYTLTLRQHLHGKRWMIMALLFVLPAGFAILARSSSPDAPPLESEFWVVFMLLPQVVLPLVALIYSSGIIQDEQEEQTITYLLIRPIPKWALYGVKLIATLTTTVVLTAFFTALTYAAIYIGTSTGENIPLRALKAIAVHSLAVVGYCCVFGLLSLLTKRILVAGVLYIVAVEGVFANLPFGIRYATIIYYTRLIAYSMLPFNVPGREGDLAAKYWQLTGNGSKLSDHPAPNTCLIVLLVASICCTIAAAVICSRREFHVKTPEKE